MPWERNEGFRPSIWCTFSEVAHVGEDMGDFVNLGDFIIVFPKEM